MNAREAVLDLKAQMAQMAQSIIVQEHAEDGVRSCC